MDDFAYNHVVLKVEDGTTTSGDSPCRTCRNGVKIRGVGNQVLRGCSNYAITGGVAMKVFPFEVAECNQYVNRCVPTLSEMQDIAWIIQADRKKGIGFLSPSENAEMEEKKGKRSRKSELPMDF